MYMVLESHLISLMDTRWLDEEVCALPAPRSQLMMSLAQLLA
jgi:hypothetical protein